MTLRRHALPQSALTHLNSSSPQVHRQYLLSCLQCHSFSISHQRPYHHLRFQHYFGYLRTCLSNCQRRHSRDRPSAAILRRYSAMPAAEDPVQKVLYEDDLFQISEKQVDQPGHQQKNRSSPRSMIHSWIKKRDGHPNSVVQGVKSVHVSDLNKFLRALVPEYRLTFLDIADRMFHENHFDMQTLFWVMRDAFLDKNYVRVQKLFEEHFLASRSLETASADLIFLVMTSKTRMKGNVSDALAFFQQTYSCYMNGHSPDRFPLEERVILELALMLHRERQHELEQELLDNHPLRSGAHQSDYQTYKLMAVDARASPNNYDIIMAEYHKRFSPNSMSSVTDNDRLSESPSKVAPTPHITPGLARYMLRLHCLPHMLLPPDMVEYCLSLLKTRERSFILKHPGNAEVLFRSAVACGNFEGAKFFPGFVRERRINRVSQETLLWWCLLIFKNPGSKPQLDMIRDLAQKLPYEATQRKMLCNLRNAFFHADDPTVRDEKLEFIRRKLMAGFNDLQKPLSSNQPIDSSGE